MALFAEEGWPGEAQTVRPSASVIFTTMNDEGTGVAADEITGRETRMPAESIVQTGIPGRNCSTGTGPEGVSIRVPFVRQMGQVLKLTTFEVIVMSPAGVMVPS